MGKTRKQVFLFQLLSFWVLMTGIKVVQSSSSHHHNGHHRRLHLLGPTKLFVFGDSYADTGNNPKSEKPWHEPYGITFPGKPAGRWSDGRVLTDYIGSLIGIKSPIPYRRRKFGAKQRHGMNFAYGGTGVFDTLSLNPNMTTQIDYFQQLIHDNGVYTKLDLDSSIALVSLAGNDYSTYFARNGTEEGLPDLVRSVVKQLALNLKRIHETGVKIVVVTALQPVGCLPYLTASSSFQRCNESRNAAVKFHNHLLHQAVEKLNNESTVAAYKILDLYSAFMSVFERQKGHPESLKFDNPLKPCCIGIGVSYSCGSIDESKVKKYTICNNTETAFFWDLFHPTQEGWNVVLRSALQSSLHSLYS
ncbi:PREDICTED: GDSL esterase/lipase At5g03610-like [Nelumbo nucifera]|uniref:GDSL esterase/lipase At5g03610-like n=1 Tax=Nelumbo nucifera TaxID=4432 RepID=A0A1U7Z592_NELNU|nr:PREDICTED: GDSL esterase/lipase At5g03610-like [Nelumbo nucifera]